MYRFGAFDLDFSRENFEGFTLPAIPNFVKTDIALFTETTKALVEGSYEWLQEQAELALTQPTLQPYPDADVVIPDTPKPLTEDTGGPNPESGTNNTTAVVNPSGDALIDGVLIGQQWTGGVIEYAFSLTATPYDYTTNGLDDLPANLTVMTALQETAVHYILDADTGPAASAGFSIEGMTGYTVNNLGQVDDVDAHIRFANTTSADLSTARVADFPGDLITGTVADDGDVWFGPYNSNVYQSPEAGNYAWATHIHEIGHAIGLAHGHDSYQHGTLPADFDSMEYSIMPLLC